MNIGIFIEMEKGRIKEANLGMISLAGKEETAGITALILDGVDEEAARTLAEYGVDRIADIRLAAGPEIRLNPDVRARALAMAATQLQLDALFGLSTAGGKDLLPRVAALADAPLVMDCMAVDLPGKIAQTSQYSGKVLADIQVTGDFLVFGIRPNAVSAVPSPKASQNITIDAAAVTPDQLALVAWDDGGQDSDQPALSEADIILAAGRGIQSRENFSLVFDCAKKMNAAVGASRAAVDENWVAYAHQVGQTGEKVSPCVYLALGISGSVQHFAGMKTAGTIIAVNTDKNAAMVANSDYYAVEDLFDILPELIKQLG